MTQQGRSDLPALACTTRLSNVETLRFLQSLPP
jgi:hypothetical protein